MKLLKKMTALLLAMALFAPVVSLSACETEETPQITETPTPPEEETPPEEDGGTDPDDPTKLKAPTLTMDVNVARWTAIDNATKYIYKRGETGKEKETTGLYVTLNDGQTLYVKAVGDNYKDSDWAQITYNYTDPYIAPPEWARKPTLSAFISGDGGEYSRFEGTVGYYEITLTPNTPKYYSFEIPNEGQYALVTNQPKTGLTIERCDASAQYISPVTHPALELEDKTLYSYVHCPASHYSTSWRATYKITCTTNANITIRFVRVGDALKEREKFITNVTAKEIAGKAQDMPISHAKAEIPWTTADAPTYFYDENYEMTFTDLETGLPTTKKGFYRLGQAGDSNAPVIWVAITSATERYLGEAFSQIQYKGDNLTLLVDTDVDGNYHMESYVDFIMNNGGLVDNANGGLPVEGDSKMACYMNVANTDGLYPVNQELFDFLNTYTELNNPILDEGVSVNKEDYWLAPCYYYVEQELGSQANPIVLSEGENTVTLPEMASVFYKIEATTATRYTLTGSAGLIYYDGAINHGVELNGFTITIDVPAEGLILDLKALSASDYTLTVTEVIE